MEALGVVRGSTIRAKHIGKDIMASLRNIVGGEVKEYTEMLTETRNESVYRMKREAAGARCRRDSESALHHVSGHGRGRRIAGVRDCGKNRVSQGRLSGNRQGPEAYLRPDRGTEP